ncbi:hypothetical protein HYS31_05625 [Candidatus Woesearchaeota archaeon]|nr:hypothetical protein [Candidatus Woesearchaeota archaeon]
MAAIHGGFTPIALTKTAEPGSSGLDFNSGELEALINGLASLIQKRFGVPELRLESKQYASNTGEKSWSVTGFGLAGIYIKYIPPNPAKETSATVTFLLNYRGGSQEEYDELIRILEQY